MNWRPKGWSNPPKVEVLGYSCDYEAYRQAYEAGADVILEALKAEADYVVVTAETLTLVDLPQGWKGWLAPIPDEEGEG